MRMFTVKLFSGSVSVTAESYAIEQGGVLTFIVENENMLSYNPRVWVEVKEVPDEQ